MISIRRIIPKMTITPFTHQRISMRTIFSREKLKLDMFDQNAAQHKLLTKDPSSFKEKIKENYEISGMKNIFHGEITRFIHLSDDESDFKTSLALVKQMLTDSSSIVDQDSLE